MRHIRPIAARAIACLLLTALPAAAADLPRVRLVATGGTISMKSSGPRLTAEELVAAVPGLDGYVKAEFEQFANVASSAMTLDQWLQLSKRLNALLSGDRGLAGVV